MSSNIMDGAGDRVAEAPRPWDLDAYRYDPETAPIEHRTVRARYDPDGEPLFFLSLMLGFLTVLTLGLGRFWALNRMRQHYWDSIELDRDPLEYRGSALEKLLGFLIAVVILGLYLSLASLALTYWGLVSFGSDLTAATLLGNGGFLMLAPVIFFAMYRSRRYVLARTRWRGIRFGMAPGASGFTLRALLYVLLTFMTLGLLYPVQHFMLTRYMIDRTWFGNMRFAQGGSWRGLMGIWAIAYILIGCCVGAIGIVAAYNDVDLNDPLAIAPVAAVGLAAVVTVYAAWIWYRVAAFRYMWRHRRLGEVRFGCDIGAGEIVAIKLVGQIGVQFLAGLLATVIFLIPFLIFAGAQGFSETFRRIAAAFGDGAAFGDYMLVAVLGLFWLAAQYATSFALTQVFLRRPVLRRQVGSISVIGAGHLTDVLQRRGDHVTEAGGFADALDVSFGVGF